MASINKTVNIGLNQWAGNEYPKRQDFVDDNLKIDTEIKALDNSLVAHKAENATQAHLPKNVGLSDVDNIKQMPISGGDFTGISKAYPNTSHTVGQVRNIILSTAAAVVSSMGEGDIWIKYK